MAFEISIKNDGDTSTIVVEQRINLNENVSVYDGVIESGSVVTVSAFKTEDDGDRGGTFDWNHKGSGLSGSDFVNADDELLVG